jgi:hydroxypyruvate isomerase
MYMSEGMDLGDFCREVRAIGFAAVEIWGRDNDFGSILEAAKANDLVLASMSGHDSLGDGLNNPANHDRIEAELVESIDLAAASGIPGLICFSGNRLAGQDDNEGMIACAVGLRRVAKHAEAKGVNLNVELLNSKVDHFNYLADRSSWGAALCEMVNSPRVKLLFDIYHMQIMEGDLIRSIRKIIQHIGHFHTAGNPGRHDLDDAQELNYRGICAAIAETGYEYYVGHEFSPKADGLDALKAAFATCDQ